MFTNIIIYHSVFKKKMFYLVMVLVLTSNAYCFSIQGNWSLIAGQGITINEPVVLSINDFIYQKQQVLQRLTFLGCQQMLLQAQFSQNQLFINYDTYTTSPLPNIACGQQNTLNKVYQSLSSVFFFAINIDQLFLNDPYGTNILIFKRIINNSVNIGGIWNMNQYGNKKTSLSVQISDKQITLCQGNLIYNYFIQSQNIIILTPVLQSCPSKDLVAAFQSTTFFHANNGILGFYDKAVSLVAQLVYSVAFDPAKPIFVSQAPTQPQPAVQVPAAPNIVGQWSIKSLFDIALPKTAYSIVITSSSIQLIGGCNSYSYNYTLNSSTQVVNIGPVTSTEKACGNSDDQLYVNGINKIYRYVYNNANGVSRLNFYDQTGNIGYALDNSKNSQANSPKSSANSVTPPSQQSPLSAGNYLLLILSRRDLPRVMVTISGNSISYKGCNSIIQTFSPSQLTLPKSSITITGGPTTNNNCAVNNDSAYFGTLNQATTYSYDASAGTVIFSNAGGSEIATLNTAN